jgi:hypothetical protein
LRAALSGAGRWKGKDPTYRQSAGRGVTAEGIHTLTGQGANVRAPGLGLLYQDGGRLVFDLTGPFPGETLFVSAKAVSFETFDPDKLGAAICVAVG